MIRAIIMAGGLGSRLNVNVEKPLFILKNKHLIDYVIENLKKSSLIDDIFVAVSPNTPLTKEYVSNIEDIIVMDTPGIDYVNDLSFIISFFQKQSENDTLLFINADLPFISNKCIDYALKKYNESNKNSLSIYIPSKFLDDLGIKYEYEYKGLVPSGLNILISQNIVQEEEELIISRVELGININTVDDIDILKNISKFENFF